MPTPGPTSKMTTTTAGNYKRRTRIGHGLHNRIIVSLVFIILLFYGIDGVFGSGVVGGGGGSNGPRSGKVGELTAYNFTQQLGTSSTAMIMFYAPWCGHCHRMMPQYEAAAARSVASSVPFYKVDGTIQRNTGLVQRFGVKGYPTVFHVANLQTVRSYNGYRDVDSLHDFATSSFTDANSPSSLVT